ncbi:MAG: lysophospholipid acyltransferase family protein [Longimicrobiales bacterium]
MTWYSFFKLIGRGIGFAAARTEVEGVENLPRKGGFFLIPNHQSVLDPILVQANCPRPVHSFTKSTQFSSPTFRWLLPRVNAIPARRYRVDPQVVRVALRLVERGEVVGIYPEGERSWDGSIQPLRRGTVRLLLKAGVPVVPCGVVGSYDVWPRWSKKPRRCRVRIRFGEPIDFGRHDTKQDREMALEAATRRLSEALQALNDPDHPATAPIGGTRANPIGSVNPANPATAQNTTATPAHLGSQGVG